MFDGFIEYDGNHAPKPPFELNQDSELAQDLYSAVTFIGGTVHTLKAPPIASRWASEASPTVEVTSGLNSYAGRTDTGTAERFSLASVPYTANVGFLARIKRKGTVGTTYRAIVSHTGSSGQQGDFYFYIDDDNQLHIDIPWVAGDILAAGGTITDTTDWHTVGFERSGSAGNWDWTTFLGGAVNETTTGNINNPDSTTRDLHLCNALAVTTQNLDGFVADAFFYHNPSNMTAKAALYESDPWDAYWQPGRVTYFVPAAAAAGGRVSMLPLLGVS